MTFATEVLNKKFQGNIVLKIGDDYFAQYTPDSGLAIDANKLGIIIDSAITPITLDIRKVKTSINSVRFTLLDKDGYISSYMGASDTSLIKEDVEFFFGFMTGSFAFGDYKSLAKTKITSLSKSGNFYRFNSAETTNLLKVPVTTTFSNLSANITDAATTLTLDNADDFSASGRIKLGDEFITYSGKSGNDLTGLTRADLSGVAAAHTLGDRVDLVITKETNSMDMALDIIENEAGVPLASIDVASFETLRDVDFSGEGNFLAYMYDVEDALEFIEDKILLATNTRLFTKDGLISIALLDQAPLAPAGLPEIDEDSTTGNPTFSLSEQKIVNKIIIEWSFVEGTKKYARTTTTTDAASIALYGEKKPLKLKYPLVTAANGGSGIVANRAARLLSRFSTPTSEINITTHLSDYNINIADNVVFTNRFLPQQGAGLGFSDVLEVLSKSPSGFGSNAKIRWKLAFTSYTGVRLGLISPSPLIQSVTSQKVFDVPDGSLYKVGYALKLWDTLTNTYETDAVNIVESISANEITMTDSFVTTLLTTHKIFFADYDDASADQKATFAYIVGGTGVFADGVNSYKIIL